ncbi:MAG: nitrilase [Acidithiobacillales bacterium SG8_45]|jgi:nitrilase|nr:MAG: nitrilase [Acidithiobacillales bacterium SG8_45]
MPKIAVVQEAPKYLDKQGTIEKAVSLVEQAAANGAELVIFPEAFVPGYPAWIWRLRPGGDWSLNEEIHSRLLDNAVNIDSDDLAPLLASAKKHQVTIVCGMHERDNQLSQSTLYNTVVTIGPAGELINRHRKLMPTNPERMVWGFGDASGLKAIDTPVGKIGSLICWENYMPLARYAMYSQGVELYIAPTYDSGDGWIGTMQHIAREGRCWVISSGVAIEASDLPEDFPGKKDLYPDAKEWVNPGDSTVIAPGGEIVEGPMRNEKGILYAEIDSKRAATAKRALDITGHYARPDIFQLHVNTEPQSPVKFSGK